MDYFSDLFDYHLPSNLSEHQEDEHADEMTDNIKVDDRCEFETDMVFKSRQSLIDWVQQTGRKLGYIIVIYRSDIGGLGRKMKHEDDWMVEVMCAEHNHDPASYMEGHPYPDRLFEVEIQIMVDMSARNVKSRDILTELKKRDPNNVSTIRTIHNALKKHKTTERSGQSQMQSVFSFLNDHEYLFDYQANHTTNELEDLFFAHPGSLDRLRAFPNVLLIDTTY
ncbi:uncharacterized protein LOC120003631 [Tripterygium wilfordii]|uniref:uncharacterized protein LOC120003631 n=1 Tax=Tripterygium wilfordii TaxID=458696 RepID=UPI0018F845CE|nr:uncharacterized protein LOC120003631 [Tripterygium wilfordii]